MSPADKIVSRSEIDERLASVARPLVFTNGVFDLLHPGHADYLARARSLGGALIVGINTDSSARLLGKGDDRPINSEADRAFMLAALESVALVTSFSERTPIELLHAVHPDIYVKGGDYDIETLDESRFVRSYGGEAHAIAFRPGYSTTALVKRIRKSKP
ncbi:D-glycero-beta-D-manno-heptose 1-phosphate adenylyltransferase [Sphingomonas paeninsulae]|uniref:D-glycero-beta-D-manno-heptose 1-phosphate adenylyltransferase n=1 Tax=Sphingomonas paeninsulae TaxID=2319844 RepID=A0A494TI21_SPHPE|nr:adenylyltransferase/cytidyltransferase family protein [Sphingomonas paeninsulae]AYJ87124.1 D-glycero-beta-D-manno-heptose 1-phosphate adenylyltransferase [Sphingomonas paeninsulae]